MRFILKGEREWETHQDAVRHIIQMQSVDFISFKETNYVNKLWDF